MPITNDRTPNLDLPLPYADNLLEDDSQRLRDALGMLDTAVASKASSASVTSLADAIDYKADLVAGKVPASQLPAYVDDVVDAPNFAALPVTGEAGKIYVLEAPHTVGGYTCTQFRWSGSAYVPIPNSPGSTDVVPEGASNLYHTAARALAAVPIATPTTLGKVRIGAGLGIDGDGLLYAAAGGGSVMSIQEIVPAFNGVTSITVPGGYVVGTILLGYNGSFLSPTDFVATDGSTIGLIGFTAGTADTFVLVKLSTVVIGSLPAGSVGTTQLGAIAAINGGQLAGMRSKIINGKMDIAQRGTTVAIGGFANGYTLDRFYVENLTGAGLSVSQQADAPSDREFVNSLRVTVVAADVSTNSTESCVLQQKIEGYNVRDLYGRTFTLSFRVRSSKTGIHCVAFGNAVNRSYVAEYTINAANTWETKSITLPGGLDTTTASWNWVNGIGLIVKWALAAGSFSQGASDTWLNATNTCATANQVNCFDTVGNIFAITGVQLEVGETATSFEHRSYGSELSLCQRYYEQVNYPAFYLPGTPATIMYIPVLLKTTKRATPTITLPASANQGYNSGGSPITPTTWATVSANVDSFSINIAAPSLGGCTGSVATASAEL